LTDLKRGKLFFVFLLFAAIDLPAQNPFIRHITTSGGLPSNCVYKVFQDSKKFIWFATDAGVARYDGTRFTYYRKQEGLSSNDVFEITEDSFGRIWFFHINASLDFFHENSIHNRKNTPFIDSLKTTNFFHKFYEDKQHNLYFYNNVERQIFTLDPQNNVRRYQLPKMSARLDVTNDSLEAMSIRYLCKNDSGEFILGTPAGCFHTRDLSKRPVLFDDSFRIKDVITSSTNEFYSITRQKNTNSYDIRKLKNGHSLVNLNPLVRTGSDYISSVLEDNNGILWISTYDKGVFCYRDNVLIYHFNIKDAKIITQDHENNIWISSLKEGVFKINPIINRDQHYESTVFKNNGIYALASNDSLGIWCTNGDNLYCLVKEKFYEIDFQDSENSFNEIMQISPGILLVAETSKLPFLLEGVRLDHAIKTIHIDHVSQSKYRLKKLIYSPQKKEISSFNQFHLYFMTPDKLFKTTKDTIIDERINNTFYNQDNALIINAKKNYLFHGGTKSECKELSQFNNKIISDHLNLNDQAELFNIEGDSLFVMKDKRIFNLTAAFDQQIDFQIRYLAYHDSTLFIATSKNIYICDNPLKILHNETVFLHMANISFRSIHAILFSNEKLYIGSDDGLTSISFQYLHDISTLAPIPYFQNIQVNEKENQVNQNVISLVSSQRVNIVFSSINYSISPVVFSYKLEGSDSDWTIAKSNNVVLQNLSKGNYTFKLRTRKPTSEWSDPIDFRIHVSATLWQHPLFYFLVIIILSGFFFLLVLRRKNNELRRRELEHQILLSEQKSLQSMMNPHFIFNSLGSIQNYLLHNKPNEAGVYLSRFARLIRQNLNAINTSMINLDEEADRLKNYLELENLRMGNKFSYYIEIDEAAEAEDIFIPSMIVQPFVENAIWHGIANLEEKGIIGIMFKFQGENSLQVIIEDTGIGIKNAEKYGYKSDSHLKLGIDITRKRLNLLGQKYGIKTGITYKEKSPGLPNPGTRIEIIVPVQFGRTESSSQ